MSDVVAGVDGAKGAWVVALVPTTIRRGAWFAFAADFAEVRDIVDRAGANAVGVDMPIGLPDHTPRVADAQARELLGPRRSSLFPTPVRAVLDAVDHADAVERNRAATGAGISIQAWNLVPQIRSVRACVGPADTDRFVECHPETSFTVMAGRPLDKKKSAAGVGQRLAALRPHMPDLDDLLATAPVAASIDDALDAIAAAWSARRLAAGDAQRLGDGAVASDGYPLQIIV